MQLYLLNLCAAKLFCYVLALFLRRLVHISLSLKSEILIDFKKRTFLLIHYQFLLCADTKTAYGPQAALFMFPKSNLNDIIGWMTYIF